jgi:hypothetical protein
MSKPYLHALSSVKKYGGKVEDYIEIHNFMDSSKATVPDHRHRALTHNSWFLSVVLERVFGLNITNSDGRKVSVRDIGEDHCLEDFGGIIPTAQDFIAEMEIKEWMGGKGTPPSHQKAVRKTTTKNVDWDNITFD